MKLAPYFLMFFCLQACAPKKKVSLLIATDIAQDFDPTLRKLKKLDGEVLIVGDTFDKTKALESQTQALAKLSLLAVALGKNDLVSPEKIPLLKADFEIKDKYRKVDSLIRTIRGLKIGVVGASYDAQIKPQDYILTSIYLRAQKVDFVIALLPLELSLAKEFIAQVDGVDVAVVLGKLNEPIVVDQTLVIAPGNLIGELTLYPKAGAKQWVFAKTNEDLATSYVQYKNH